MAYFVLKNACFKVFEQILNQNYDILYGSKENSTEIDRKSQV